MADHIFVFGGSGHAKVVLDAIICAGRERVARRAVGSLARLPPS